MKLGLAQGWHDVWWTRTVGPNAFVVETGLAASPAATDVEDVRRVANLARLAWCIEHDCLRGGADAPNLITGAGDDGVVIANVDPGTLYQAMKESHAGVIERMNVPPEPTPNPVYAYVLMHLEGSTVRPWSVLGRGCVFGMAESISGMREAMGYVRIAGDAEDECMPSGPPMSPLTVSYFTMWALFDVRFGSSRETMGCCIVRIAPEFYCPSWLTDTVERR